jgi:hypothetical protein
MHAKLERNCDGCYMFGPNVRCARRHLGRWQRQQLATYGPAAAAVEPKAERSLAILSKRQCSGDTAGFHAARDRYNGSVQPFLPAFELRRDLGYYAFSPSGLNIKPVANITAEDVAHGLDLEGLPGTVVGLDAIRTQLPLQFLSACKFPGHASSYRFPNRFPHDISFIVPAHVAARRLGAEVLLDGTSVRFVVGGSLLNFLDQRKGAKGNTFVVQRHGPLVFVKKQSDYVTNVTHVGYQFERLVCGGLFQDKHDPCAYEHLQLVQVGDHGVLFAADGDAITYEDGNLGGPIPVEIKCSNPKHWKLKLPLQMTSAGATTLVYGTKTNSPTVAPTLVEVGTKSLTQLFIESGKDNVRFGQSQERIITGLDVISEQAAKLPEGHLARLVFERGELRMIEETNRSLSLLPPANVVRKLLFQN